jgi:hypothetical protein
LDVPTLSGNVEAAQNAVKAFESLQRAVPSSGQPDALTALRKAQIKLTLMQDLNTGGTSGKAVLDDAELNYLMNSYAELNRAREIATEGKHGLSRSTATASDSLSHLFSALCTNGTPTCGYAQIDTDLLAQGIAKSQCRPSRADQQNQREMVALSQLHATVASSKKCT